MFMQQDWLMRQIELIAIALARLLFGKGSKEYDLQEEQDRAAGLKRRLTELLSEGRLGEAENLLFFKLDEGDQRTLAVAIDFYRQANALSDEELEAQDFTRSELWEGLRAAVEQYGLYIPGFWDEA